MRVLNFRSIRFTECSFDYAVKFIKYGGLFCFPSGPGLSTLNKDKEYSNALKSSTLNFFDSGFFCILLFLFGFRYRKFSGYLFIKKLINYFKDNHFVNFLFVDPDEYTSKLNKIYLEQNGIFSHHQPYIAPIYKKNSPIDLNLLNIINKNKPKLVILNIAGGVQEKLGSWLLNNLDYRPLIICTGAAISFFSGGQAQIPKFMDKLFLGWLFRCIKNPNIFVIRYLKAFHFFYIFLHALISKDIKESNKNK